MGAVSATDLPTGWWPIQPGDKIEAASLHGNPRYLTWMADSQIKHGVAPTHAYTQSAFYSGVMRAYERTNDTRYLDYVKHKTDIVLYPAWNGEDILLYNDSQSIDDIRFGHTFLDMYEVTGNDIYKTAADVLKAQIDRSKRTPDGGFYHRFPVYMDQMWLDGIYMLDVYYARYTAAFEADNGTAWDDIALQFDLIDAGTTAHRNRTAGLPVHGSTSARAPCGRTRTRARRRTSGRAASAGTSWRSLTPSSCSLPRTRVARVWWATCARWRMPSCARRTGRRAGGGRDGPRARGRVGQLRRELRVGHVRVRAAQGAEAGTARRRGVLGGGARWVQAHDGDVCRAEGGGWRADVAVDGADGEPELERHFRGELFGLFRTEEVQSDKGDRADDVQYYASQPLYENDLKGVAPFLFSSYEYELYLENKGSC